MNRKELEAMVACADCGSIARAAKHLGVDRSSISRKLAKLEGEFGVDLFHTTPEGIVPTYAGELYVGTAREILAIYEQTVNELTENLCNQ